MIGKQYVKILKICALTLILPIVLLEMISRWLVWEPQGYTFTGTDRQGFSTTAIGDWVPNQDAVWIDRLEYPYYIHINSDGFRNIDNLNPKSKKVLVLGDSQTFGLYISSQDIWTQTAERIINAKYSDSVQLLNTALPGSTITDHLEYIRNKAHLLKPDVVLLTVYQNDIFDLAKSKTTFGATRENMQFHALDARQRNYALRRFLNENLAMYSLARKAKDIFLKKHAVQQIKDIANNRMANTETARKNEKLKHQELEILYKQLFNQTLTAIHSLNADVKILYIPSPTECGNGPSRTQKLLVDMVERGSLSFLNVHSHLCANKVFTVYFSDPAGVGNGYKADSHLSRFGHIILGQAVANFLTK